MAYNNTKVRERQTTSSSQQTQTLGIVSEVPMNEWNAAISYEKLNLVTYRNATFIAKRANVNIPPLDTPNWEETWMLLKSGIGISSVVVEYAKGDVTSSNPPQSGWSTDLPSLEVKKLLWTRVTISYTDGTSTVYYSVGVSSAPTKTSDLINDGDGTSPFATEKALNEESGRAKNVENGLDTRVKSVETKIPSDASAENPLETRNFINSSINALAAFFITPTATGDKAFATRSALIAAKTFYSGGKARIPTQNDYAIVLADESQAKGADGSYPTTRYSYQGGTYPNGQWDFQYIVNNTSLTQAQVNALNSGIDSRLVEQITVNQQAIYTLLKSLDNYVTKEGDETIDGLKTFGQELTVTNRVGTATLYPSRLDLLDNEEGGNWAKYGASQIVHGYGGDGAAISLRLPEKDGTLVVDKDLQKYAKLDGAQTFTGTKTFQDRVELNDVELHDVEFWGDTHFYSSLLLVNSSETQSTEEVFLPSRGGTLALVEQIRWANLPDKPTIPTIPNLSRTVSGSGNAVTDITVSGHTITITKGETFAKNADLTALTGRVSTIEGKIPTQASATDQLAPKSFVNSTVQTATANFRGNWETWASVPSAVDSYPVDYAGSKTPTVNDYLVVQDASGFSGKTLTGTWRFKYSGTWGTNGKNGWQPEYQVNETPLTAAQLAALNSGITSSGVGQITTNKNNITSLLNRVSAIEGDYVTTDTDQTITSKKTFSQGAQFDQRLTANLTEFLATGFSSAVSFDYSGIRIYNAKAGGGYETRNTVTYPTENGRLALKEEITWSNMTGKPTSLKNPYSLSITANGTTVTYDGSSAKSITIPSGSSYSAGTGIAISTANVISTIAASQTASGHVSTAAQSFSGLKNFYGGVNIMSGVFQIGGSSGKVGQVLCSNGPNELPSWASPALDIFRVGYVYISYSSTSPANLFGGSWTSITGVFPYFNAGTSTGGSNTHTLTVNELPPHRHQGYIVGQQWTSTEQINVQQVWGKGEMIDDFTEPTGGGASFSTMPKYQTFYAWRRTA